MKHQFIDAEITGDDSPQFREIKANVDVLLPIRGLRLIRLKNTLREEETTLRQLNREYQTGLRRLDRKREAYKKTIDEFAQFHTGVILIQEKLHQTLEAEKVARDLVLKQEAENYDMAMQIDNQTSVVEEAKAAVKVCQSDIEKLEYIKVQKDFQ